jgi:hypothetical protein
VRIVEHGVARLEPSGRHLTDRNDGECRYDLRLQGEHRPVDELDTAEIGLRFAAMARGGGRLLPGGCIGCLDELRNQGGQIRAWLNLESVIAAERGFLELDGRSRQRGLDHDAHARRRKTRLARPERRVDQQEDGVADLERQMILAEALLDHRRDDLRVLVDDHPISQILALRSRPRQERLEPAHELLPVRVEALRRTNAERFEQLKHGRPPRPRAPR